MGKKHHDLKLAEHKSRTREVNVFIAKTTAGFPQPGLQAASWTSLHPQSLNTVLGWSPAFQIKALSSLDQQRTNSLSIVDL